MSRIVVVEAGLGTPSSTRLLADRLAVAVTGRFTDAGSDAVTVETVSLRELAHPLADHLLTRFPTGVLAEAIDRVAHADALIVVSPVFAASYSGLFKTFFDVLEPGLIRGVPVLLAATAGTARHSLVLEHALRPLLSYLGAVTAPTGVFAAAEDWGAAGESALGERIDRAATDLASLMGLGGAKVLPARDRETPELEAPGSFIEALQRTAR